ncbi:MAG: site-specific DNA-methyltransferase [Novosphingobium sp.]|nr:site-specific DNA-methyltransferase [Novosphingobium sp.]
MPQLSAKDPAAHSGDVVGENVAALKALFPQIVTDGKVDFEVLRQLLGDTVEEGEERYGLNWKGKAKARAHALTPTLATLRPAREDSVDWDTTRNLMIEGDNLEVLKCLRKAYAGKVKLIYIDPPYNTGKDFVYPDNYTDSMSSYLELTGQRGFDGTQLTSNKEGSGRFHTDWLNLMYPRLLLAREFLAGDGAILVSCNDQESANLKSLLDEIMGPDNFAGQIVWQRSKKGDAKLIASVHEYVLCYVRDKAAVLANGMWRKPKEGAAEVLAQYQLFREKFGDNHMAIRGAMQDWYRSLNDSDPRKAHKHYSWSDARGLYFADNFAGPDDGRASRPRHDIFHPITDKACKKPSTGWRWDENKTAWALEQDPPRIHFGPDETTIPCRKSYLAEIDSEPFSSVFYRDGRSATLEVEGLVGKGVFQFPKNTEVLADFIELTTRDGDLILDFFAGSGSTGHAIYKLNAQRADKRRFALVQLPEPTELQSFPTIADVTKERLRRAGAKVKADNPGAQLDTGFRVFKLDRSNLKPWQPDADNLEASLLDAVSNIVHGRSEEDLLVELLLKTGIDLTTPEEVREIAGKTVHALGGGALIVCLADVADADAEKLGHGIAEWQAELDPPGQTTLYFKDEGFASACAKANLAAILRQRMGDRIAKLASI